MRTRRKLPMLQTLPILMGCYTINDWKAITHFIPDTKLIAALSMSLAYEKICSLKKAQKCLIVSN